MPDLTEQILRRTLASQARPQLQPTLAADVLRLVAARQRLAESRRGRGARLLLAAYWLAASVATAWIVRDLPLPSWSATLLWGLAWVGVPLGYAFLLWPQWTARWAVLFLKPLLVDARAERS